MIDRVHRATLFVLYQLSILIGIVLLPVALAAKRLGLTLPLHRVLEGIGSKYENAAAN